MKIIWGGGTEKVLPGMPNRENFKIECFHFVLNIFYWEKVKRFRYSFLQLVGSSPFYRMLSVKKTIDNKIWVMFKISTWIYCVYCLVHLSICGCISKWMTINRISGIHINIWVPSTSCRFEYLYVNVDDAVLYNVELLWTCGPCCNIMWMVFCRMVTPTVLDPLNSQAT